MATKILRKLIDEDPSMRLYFSREVLTSQIVMGRRGAPMMGAKCKEGEEPDCPVAELLLEVPGVDAAEVHPYHVAVFRAQVYEWSEIEPKILALLMAFNKGEGRLEEVYEAV